MLLSEQEPVCGLGFGRKASVEDMVPVSWPENNGGGIRPLVLAGVQGGGVHPV